MGRTLFSGLICWCLISPAEAIWAQAAGMALNNPALMNGLNGILQGQLTELRNIKSSGASQLNIMELMQKSLGAQNLPISPELGQLSAWSRKFGLPDSYRASLLNSLGNNAMNIPGLPQLYPQLPINQVSQKLFVDKGSLQNFSQVQQVQSNRSMALQQASTIGIAVSGKNKHEFTEIRNKIADLGNQTGRANSLHEDIRVTNQLLVLIATQLSQQNEMVAQQLELSASVAAQSLPIGGVR
jgi:hypothetical protein